jgi:ribosome maturation protein Sdo1
MAMLERLQILVTEEQRRWLEAESKRRGEAVTALVREAIETARTRRSPRQRLEALNAMQPVWAASGQLVATLPIDELNRLIDDGRLVDATGDAPA